MQKKKINIEDQNPDFIIRNGCPNMMICKNYFSPGSSVSIWNITGCPDTETNPNECKFYKEVLKYISIDKQFARVTK